MYKIMKPFYKDIYNKDLTYADYLKEENDKTEFAERIFDLKKKKINHKNKREG